MPPSGIYDLESLDLSLSATHHSDFDVRRIRFGAQRNVRISSLILATLAILADQRGPKWVMISEAIADTVRSDASNGSDPKAIWHRR
jgi:hypothetical protein